MFSLTNLISLFKAFSLAHHYNWALGIALLALIFYYKEYLSAND